MYKLLIFLLLGLSLGLVAQKKNKPKPLDDIVIIATGNERDIYKTPYSVFKLSEDLDIMRLQSRSLTESLGAVPGILLQKTGHGMTAPYLRGVTGQRIVLLADGIRLNNSVLRDGPNQYWNLLDHYFYENTEVLMGPASVLYGSDAIGGVVHTRSTLIQGESDAGMQWLGGKTVLRVSSAENSFSEYLGGSFAIDDKWTVKLGSSRQDFGALESGNSETNHQSDFEQWAFNMRTTYWITKDHRIVFGFENFDQDDVDRIHRTEDHIDYYGTRSKGSTDDIRRVYDHDRRMSFARYELRNSDSIFNEVDFTISHQYMEEAYKRHKNTDPDYQHRQFEVDTLGINLRLKTLSNLGTWSYGFDHYHDFVKSEGYDTSDGVRLANNPSGVIADDAEYEQTGIYLQNEYALNDKLDLITGIRYTYVDMDAEKVNFNGSAKPLSGNWDQVTASVRFFYKAIEDNKLNLFIGVSQGFRAPNLSDSTRDDEFGAGSESPTADLDSEKFLSYEIGSKSQGKWGYFLSNFYFIDIEDQIARVKSGADNTKRNLDESYIQGVELAAGYNLGEYFQFFGDLSWQEGEEENFIDRDISNPTANFPISRIAPLMGTLGIKVFPNDKLWLELSWDFSEKQDKYSLTDEDDNRFPPNGTPAWQSFNIRSGWAIKENLSISMALENIEDERYRVHGSGINEPGRNYIMSLIYNF